MATCLALDPLVAQFEIPALLSEFIGHMVAFGAAHEDPLVLVRALCYDLLALRPSLPHRALVTVVNASPLFVGDFKYRMMLAFTLLGLVHTPSLGQSLHSIPTLAAVVEHLVDRMKGHCDLFILLLCRLNAH